MTPERKAELAALDDALAERDEARSERDAARSVLESVRKVAEKARADLADLKTEREIARGVRTAMAHGLYVIRWRAGGGVSLAAVGSDSAGRNWYAPTNWIVVPSFDWAEVESAEPVLHSEQKRHPEVATAEEKWREGVAAASQRRALAAAKTLPSLEQLVLSNFAAGRSPYVGTTDRQSRHVSAAVGRLRRKGFIELSQDASHTVWVVTKAGTSALKDIDR